MFDYGYDFGCTSDAEFLLEWGCALVAGPAPFQLKYTHKAKTNKFKPEAPPRIFFLQLGSIQNVLIFRLLLKITVNRITTK